jgi:hypothetical protein
VDRRGYKTCLATGVDRVVAENERDAARSRFVVTLAEVGVDARTDADARIVALLLTRPEYESG